MEALISNFKTLLTEKGHYVTHLPYMLMCILLHNTAETLRSVVSHANIYICEFNLEFPLGSAVIYTKCPTLEAHIRLYIRM